MWGVPLALGSLVAWKILAPAPPPPVLLPARATGPVPPPRRLYDVDLTIVRGSDQALLASTSPEIRSRPAAPDDELYLVATTSGTRVVYARLFAVDARGEVVALTADAAPPLSWSAPPDGGTYPAFRLDFGALVGDVRLRAYLSFYPFQLARAEVAGALRRSGQAPLGPEPLPVPLPPGIAGAALAEMSILIERRGAGAR
jgi:hypothetical protein